MDFPAMKEAQGKLDAARKSLRDVFAEAGPTYDMSKVKSIEGDTDSKVGWIRTKNEEITGLKKKVEDLRVIGDAATEAALGEEDKGTRGDDNDGGRKDDSKMGIGERFVKSDAFKTKGAASHFDIETKTLFQTGTAGGAGWPPESVRSGRVELTPQAPAPHVVDFIPGGSISQPLYKYMEETTFATDSADSDNLANVTAEGGTFTEGQLALTERSQAVEKLTIWIPMTDEQLEDVPGAQSYVQQRMTYMIRAKLDKELLQGSGSSNHLKGTENVSGIQTQAKGADTLIDAAYKLFTSIRTDGFAEPNVAFVNPSKWQEVDLLKTADGVYIWGQPSSVGPRVLWGVPVVLSFSHTSTKLIAGDYATYAMFFEKRGIDVQVTNAHSDYFIKGKQAIRMDMRGVMVHHRPKAFGVVTGL